MLFRIFHFQIFSLLDYDFSNLMISNFHLEVFFCLYIDILNGVLYILPQYLCSPKFCFSDFNLRDFILGPAIFSNFWLSDLNFHPPSIFYFSPPPFSSLPLPASLHIPPPSLHSVWFEINWQMYNHIYHVQSTSVWTCNFYLVVNKQQPYKDCPNRHDGNNTLIRRFLWCTVLRFWIRFFCFWRHFQDFKHCYIFLNK